MIKLNLMVIMRCILVPSLGHRLIGVLYCTVPFSEYKKTLTENDSDFVLICLTKTYI